MKKHDESLRKIVLDEINNGLPVKQACRLHGIKSRSTIYLWKKEANPIPQNQISARQLYLMRTELERLRVENEILRCAGCSENSPLNVRNEAFVRLSKEYPLNRLCRVLGLTRGAGHYLRDHRVEKTIFEKRDDELRPLVKEVFDGSLRTYGKRRIRAKLRQKGIIVSERKASQLMSEQGLVSRHEEYHWIRNAPRCSYYPNKLQRHFAPEIPDTVWSADLTYIRVQHEWRYFFAIIDLCRRRVIGWGLSDCKTSEFTSSVLKRAFYSRGEPFGLIYHTDQGTENTEFIHREWACSHGIVRSYSAPGSPHDNAVSEAFFATFKKEFVRKRVFASEEILYAEIDQYINFYNNERIHSSIGMMSPTDAESGLLGLTDKILD